VTFLYRLDQKHQKQRERSGDNLDCSR
jgi:hypothetical protein